MLNLFRVGKNRARYARGDVDQPPSGIATPELAAAYFRSGASVFAVLWHDGFWRLGAFVSGVLLSTAARASSDFFFRCPACGYTFETGPWHTEPKWHACPSCGIQFTAERKLRWPPW
jgi:hypothetical protein